MSAEKPFLYHQIKISPESRTLPVSPFPISIEAATHNHEFVSRVLQSEVFADISPNNNPLYQHYEEPVKSAMNILAAIRYKIDPNFSYPAHSLGAVYCRNAIQYQMRKNGFNMLSTRDFSFLKETSLRQWLPNYMRSAPVSLLEDYLAREEQAQDGKELTAVSGYFICGIEPEFVQITRNRAQHLGHNERALMGTLTSLLQNQPEKDYDSYYNGLNDMYSIFYPYIDELENPNPANC